MAEQHSRDVGLGSKDNNNKEKKLGQRKAMSTHGKVWECTWSASMWWAPREARNLAAEDLPLAIPPVSPITRMPLGYSTAE
jgi:hypothetical protein